MTITTSAPVPVATGDAPSMLDIRGLGKSFAGRPVLRDIDLQVPAGSSLSVVGPSGCGKTTLLRVIAGFERPDAGTVVMEGRTLCARGVAVPAHRRGIGYVPQDGALFPHLSVAGNVGFGIPRRQRTTERVVELLERVSLSSDVLHRRPDQLSGGQQQRVAVARALAQSPSMVLLDEPFSALDAGLRSEIRDAVGQALRTSGVTCILVTHDHEEALSFAERVALLRAGALVQSGTPRELYTGPVDDEAGEFFGEVVRLSGRYDRSAQAVWTPFGPVAVRGADVGPGDGQPVTVALRPEQLLPRRCGETGSASGGVGTVTAVRFLGSAVRCEVRVDGVGELVLRTRSQDAPVAGDRVTVSIVGEGWLSYLDSGERQALP